MGVNIIVDGTTGVGKTSLIKILTEEFEFIAYNEIFRDDNNLLGRFFNEGNRWCFPMQVSFLNNRYLQYIEAMSIENAIMDRSIYSDPIFADMYLQEGNMSSEEHSVYEALYHSLTSSLTPPGLVIYLDVTAEEAIRRIRRRGREDEIQMPNQYWKNLHKCYTHYYQKYSSSSLLKLDVTHLDYVHNKKDRDFVVGQVSQALKAIPNNRLVNI